MSQTLRLAVALDGAGWHPAAWREPDAPPGELFTAGYWADLAAEAERGLLDFVTIEDSLSPQTDRTDRVQGRLDAVLIASRIAPLTRNLGFVPTVIATHTEPFHISKAIATLDYVSTGRAGLRVRVSGSQAEADHFGRREVLSREDLFDEAADYVEVVRRLWDSWEDDAEIRDVATGRFVDREKLHYIDFEGRFFDVKGPSITPRPPQGQPPVAVLAHVPVAYRLAERSADLVFVTEPEPAVRGPLVFTDLVVFLDETEQAAADRKARLDEVAGEEYTSDAEIFVGTPSQLADRLLAREAFGFRLRPGAVPHDLRAVTRGLVPELQRRGAFRTAYEANTLRGLLGLDRPANRYAA
ncbi:alkanesulfonate monooxygenase SsuD/methylene tetrahydromethanopterin reductase-like flavin-dependent oxidoreductase (luciferase family) [Amycolatopsis bartoniae]|uniref:FMNH2-utilizing oxygenase n=1 Tax=Amycolatopsis bartoniae TaxID=941986 RepID=A0A8H9J3S0_9PSEU|nr:LLM class flavin-dependent oxidoreductase [Amycolatopsis bartoniae]MBB2934169.1 alkanesulfonate monooxygenase SsuD/methylene tetrahydromethanopterin reductase-like flavin-dependent oxidoreductase (luciferase family) [Amycolatopsis bartoniae]TVT08716.1 LLM class flavin-dependent oxidoreductase [Amycolatopsis bartoniae]GHF88740.1 FMNH2-utilizing oxygenase [Amycolatopsis bartoniae]